MPVPPFFVPGENLAVMQAMLPEFAGKIDLIYADPPFATGHSFTVSETGRAAAASPSGETTAYRDDLPFEAYQEFIRERALLIRELLSQRGSFYLHTDLKTGHYLKVILDGVFGRGNFVNDITRVKSNPKNFTRRAYGNQKDLILFYAKDRRCNIFNDLREPLAGEEIRARFRRRDPDGRCYTTVPLHAPGISRGPTGEAWRGILPPEGRHWRTDPAVFDRLDREGRIEWSKNGNPRLKKYADEHPGKKIQDIWVFKDPQNPVYPTEKNRALLERIIGQSSLPESLVMDPFAGSGALLKAAASLGRRWIGIDNSPVSAGVIREYFGPDVFAEV